ncbi:MAG: 6-carboxytetrahydropterin synthase QueD [Lachnospiraceae bacterium]|nr:6-carboxytetrahydropterin synthase QueD [Lachnospiraceae bacterium]
MYTIRTEQNFDSAHFLAGYDGKCSNLHGHRWRVVAEVRAEVLQESGQLRGMVADFGVLKQDLKMLADSYDHAFIYETGSLKEKTLLALKEEGFQLIEVPFRPTAENFARHFYECMERMGYCVKQVEVYETPNNCAVYSGGDSESLQSESVKGNL